MDLSWIFFAVLAAVTQAAFPLLNEYFQVRPLYLMFWMRAFALAALLPVLLFLPLPEDPLFYLFVLAGAFIFSYFDIVYVGVGASKGAGVVTRIEPLIVGATFLIWLAIVPAQIGELAASPLRTGGIVAGFAGSLYFALRLRHCAVSASALREMALPIVLGAMGVICGKLAMNHSEALSGTAYYSLFQNLFALAIYLVILALPAVRDRLAREGGASLFDKRVLLAGAVVAVNWILHTPTKYFAIDQVANPAYVTVVTLTSPLWVLLLYRIAGRREKADIVSGLGIVFCAAVLVLFSSF